MGFCHSQTTTHNMFPFFALLEGVISFIWSMNEMWLRDIQLFACGYTGDKQ